VTDDKNLEKQERKRLQVEHARRKSDWTKILKLADKTSKSRSDRRKPSSRLVRRTSAWVRGVGASEGLTGVSPWLEKEFEQAAQEAER
jgi:guanosine-3',5'-bis(diphosphate) 3'-pyrophosphohydrolase